MKSTISKRLVALCMAFAMMFSLMTVVHADTTVNDGLSAPTTHSEADKPAEVSSILVGSTTAYYETDDNTGNTTYIRAQLTGKTEYDLKNAAVTVNLQDKVRSARITDGEDGSNGTIKLNLPVGIDLTSLSPEVDYAGEGFYYTVDDQRSDKTEEIDFTKKIGLVVYNTEYETEATYDVFVTAEKSVENDILSYKIGDAVGTISGSKLDSWEIKNVTKNEIVVPEYVASNHPADGSSYMIPYFTVDGTSDYEIKAIFKAKDHGNVNVTVNDESMGTATAQIGAGEAATSINDVVEGTEVKLQAQPNLGYVFQGWSATYGSDNTQVVIANSTAAQTTFVMPATNRQPVNVVATFAEDPNYLSEECVLESVLLLNHSGNTFEGDQDGTAFTVTLPADADASNLANMVLKLTYSKNAKVFRDGDTAAWNANGQACNMTLGTVTKFVVRSQKDLTEGNEGPTREYTITIQKAASPGTPTLSNGSATRTSKTGATVKFTSSEAGNYFYKVVDHGATAPTADEIMKSTTKGTASTGEITFILSNLTEDARDIYIVVVSAAGGESAPLKVEIPAYGSGTDTPDTGAYKILIRAPKGGTITTNRTKADAGEEIIVTVTPDNGYQMVSGSLSYTLETAGGETKTISNGRFTMPAGDVSITCKWETATTTAKGITSFSINGVAGAVNNSTNTITITMPRGTDVTKLTPVIATNGVKSLTPGNGETVNFTNAVTYTVAMEDGSSKTYTVTVYVDKGTLADQFWDKLTDFATQVPWWQYAEKQQSTSKYPKYW